MLSALHIRNFALFDSLDLSFGPGLNVLTGETGAGKSMLVGAMEMIFGKRFDHSLIFHEDLKCIIEAEFAALAPAVVKALKQRAEFDMEGNEILIRREQNTKGKSRAFINDTPVSIQCLKEVAGMLVDMHGQHENQSLIRSDSQIEALDSFSDSEALCKQFSETFHAHRQLRDKLDALRNEESNIKRQSEYYRFQADELIAAALEDWDEAALEQELKVLENAGAILTAGADALDEWYQSDRALFTRLSFWKTKMEKQNFPPEYVEGLNQLSMQLKDLSLELESFLDALNADPKKLEKVKLRYDELNHLKAKYKVKNREQLLKLRDEYAQKANEGINFESQTLALSQEIYALEKALITLGLELESKRKNGIKSLEKAMKNLLPEAALDKAIFSISMQRNQSKTAWLEIENQKVEPNAKGINQIQFLFSANPGLAPLPLSQVASGGEISRLMLSLKTAFAGKAGVPCLIFDEIDAGISGETAMRIAALMQKTARQRQIIAISHLPQIAAASARQYQISKESKGKSTRSFVEELSGKERISALARMIGGESHGNSAEKTAKELLANFKA